MQEARKGVEERRRKGNRRRRGEVFQVPLFNHFKERTKSAFHQPQGVDKPQQQQQQQQQQRRRGLTDSTSLDNKHFPTEVGLQQSLRKRHWLDAAHGLSLVSACLQNQIESSRERVDSLLLDTVCLTVSTDEDAEEINAPWSLWTEDTFLPQLRIKVHSVSVCSYCPTHNPPLQVCLYRDRQLPFGKMSGQKKTQSVLIPPSLPETACLGSWRRVQGEELHKIAADLLPLCPPPTAGGGGSWGETVLALFTALGNKDKSNQINFIYIAHNHIASMSFTICTVKKLAMLWEKKKNF